MKSPPVVSKAAAAAVAVTDLRVRRAVVVILLVAVTALFLVMISGFLVTILMAAIFSGLAYPLRRRLGRALGGRHSLAAAIVVVLFFLLVVVPVLAILGLAASQALQFSESVRPWFENPPTSPRQLDRILRDLPFYPTLEPYRVQIAARAAEFASDVGSFLLATFKSTTRNVFVFLFHFFLFLYTMYYLVKDGAGLLNRIRAYLPIPDGDQDRILEKFTSVTRAMLRGTLVIGIAQGTLAGIAFAVAGVDGSLLWGAVMVGFSVIPGLGTAVIWVPTVIVLLFEDRVGAAIGLALFCVLVVGTIDNVLRPRLVGRDTRMHPLLIFFSTIGGLALFGLAGFLIGPILAALFVVAWDMFGATFRGSIDRARGLECETDAVESGDV